MIVWFLLRDKVFLCVLIKTFFNQSCEDRAWHIRVIRVTMEWRHPGTFRNSGPREAPGVLKNSLHVQHSSTILWTWSGWLQPPYCQWNVNDLSSAGPVPAEMGITHRAWLSLISCWEPWNCAPYPCISSVSLYHSIFSVSPGSLLSTDVFSPTHWWYRVFDFYKILNARFVCC